MKEILHEYLEFSALVSYLYSINCGIMYTGIYVLPDISTVCMQEGRRKQTNTRPECGQKKKKFRCLLHMSI